MKKLIRRKKGGKIIKALPGGSSNSKTQAIADAAKELLGGGPKKRTKMTDAQKEQKRIERNAKNRLSPEEKAARAAAREADKEAERKAARVKANRKKMVSNTKKRTEREQKEYDRNIALITGRLKNREIKPKDDGSATDESTFRKDQGRGSYERAQTLEKGSMAELADTYDKLLKGRQRGERLKKDSRFSPLFEKRGMADLSKKAGGMVKKMGGGKIYKRGHGGPAKSSKVVRRKNGGSLYVSKFYD